MTAPGATAIVLGSVVGMEIVAWAVHRYIMHGWGWAWHRDHHEADGRRFERNDLYALVFAIPVIGLFILGGYLSPGLWWLACGITLYGVLYAIVHDGLIHQRLFRWVPKHGYARRLVQAHRLHHAALGREGGVSFGFLFARDPRHLREDLRAQHRAGRVRLAERRGAGGDAD